MTRTKRLALAALLALPLCACGSEPNAEVVPEPSVASEAVPPPQPDNAPAVEPTVEPTHAAVPTSAESEVGTTTGAAPALQPEVAIPATPFDPEVLHEAIRQVVRMPSNRPLARAARAHHMRIQNLSWEDTGRSFGSSVGPNISDLTLEVHETRTNARGRTFTRTSLLPVLRYPNFTDRTADLPSDQFWVRVGNQTAGTENSALTPVPLTEVLGHLRTYLSDPESLRGDSDDFTAPRDTHYLVSAQHVFVPLPQGAQVTWAPVLFNYQSSPSAPAVLCLVITREGTSIQIIENRTDPLHPDGWGQRLYFNHGGQRTLFTAERRSDVAVRIEAGHATADDATALEEGADMVMIVQVPLRQRAAMRSAAPAPMSMGMGMADESAGFGAAPSSERQSDVERAVVGHALEEGPMNEVRNQRIRRDPRFPIRVTVQFYRATSNGVVSEDDLNAAVAQIERIYSDADFVGSLVVGSQERPTSWIRPTATP
jgi:hypothetical protein